MKKKHWTNIVFFSLLSLLIFIGISMMGVVSADTKSRDGVPGVHDITEHLKINEYYMMNKNEEECTEFTEGDEVFIRVKFEINPLPQNKTADDYFYITLPESPYFEFSGNGTANDYLTYVVENGRAIFTLTEAGAAQEHLVNGVFVLHGKAKTAGTGISGGGDGKYDENGVVIYPNQGGSGNQTDDHNNQVSFPDEAKVLRKNGKQWNGADVIAWSGLVNYQGYSSMFTDEVVEQKTNGLLIDHLEPGTTYKEGTLHISIPCYISNLNGVMGERQIGEGRVDGHPQDTNFTDIVIHDEAKNDMSLRAFKQLDAAGMTYEEYLAFVRAYPEQNNGQRVYGVYTHEDGTQTVLIAFGDLPGGYHYYKDLRKDFGGNYGQIGIFEAIDLDKTLTDGQKDHMKRIYSQDGPSGGAVTAYNFSFAVDVDTPKYGSGVYHNKIEFIYSEDGREEAEADTEFLTSYASVDGEFLSVKKKVDGTGTLEAAKVFCFVIEDEGGQAVAYGRTEAIDERGKEVEVLFYKDAQYKYPVERHDETSEAHWYNLLQPGKWYYLKEVNTSGYTAEVLDGRSHVQNNRFIYNKNIKNLWKFLVVNYEKEVVSEKTDLTVHNIWEDDDNRDGKRPEYVNVQLYANETPVSDEVVTFEEANDWSHTWENLDVTDESGEIEYSAEAIDVPECYDKKSEKQQVNTVILTNKHEPEKVIIEGEKLWNDNDNQAGRRPESIAVNLFADGVKVAEQKVTAEMEWKYSFSGHLRYEKGREIIYMVQESPVEGYSARYEGYDIINDYTPERTSRTVRKLWKDADNPLKRPEEIKVQLYSDGKESGDEIILNETNEWQYTWTDLPEEQNGKDIEYTIKELDVPVEYEVSYDEDGTIIVNTWKEPGKKEPGKKAPGMREPAKKVDTKNKVNSIRRTGVSTTASKAAKTGDNTRFARYILMMLLAVLGTCIYVAGKRKYGKKDEL